MWKTQKELLVISWRYFVYKLGGHDADKEGGENADLPARGVPYNRDMSVGAQKYPNLYLLNTEMGKNCQN